MLKSTHFFGDGRQPAYPLSMLYTDYCRSRPFETLEVLPPCCLSKDILWSPFKRPWTTLGKIWSVWYHTNVGDRLEILHWAYL